MPALVVAQPGVEISFKTKKGRFGRENYKAKHWALGITDFCGSVEQKKRGTFVLRIGPVSLKFNLDTQNLIVYSSQPLEPILGTHGTIVHARQRISSVINALSLFPRSLEHQVLNITIGSAVVTLQKQKGLLEIGGSGVEIK
ncbi:MAG: hypothetical protein RJA61_191 [Candidatus Parcubacteria bacterium]|jgi:hypothetical protein